MRTSQIILRSYDYEHTVLENGLLGHSTHLIFSSLTLHISKQAVVKFNTATTNVEVLIITAIPLSYEQSRRELMYQDTTVSLDL
jgi:hypothetical protein